MDFAPPDSPGLPMDISGASAPRSELRRNGLSHADISLTFLDLSSGRVTGPLLSFLKIELAAPAFFVLRAFPTV